MPDLTEKTPRPDLIGGRWGRQYGIDKEREDEMPMGEIVEWQKKRPFEVYASSNNAEDANGTDLRNGRTEVEGRERYRTARDMDSKHH